MAFNIKDFMTHAAKYGEFAKADKFEVKIPLPGSFLRAGSKRPDTAFGSRELTFQCEATELPGRNITMIEYRHHAFVERVPHITNYTDINLTFYCNNRFLEKKFFDAWLDTIIPTNTGYVQYYSDDSNQTNYTSDIEITQFDLTGSPIYRCTLVEAIPTGITPLNLNWSDDSVHRLSVTFAFKKWRTQDITDNLPTQEPVRNRTKAN